MSQERKAPLRRTPEQQVAHHKAKMEAAQKKLAQTGRDLDTRRKVVLGAMLMSMADAGDAGAVKILSRIKGRLERSRDRKLFGLPELIPSTAADLTEDELVQAVAGAAIDLGQAKGAGRPQALRALGEAAAALERKTGKAWNGLSSMEERRQVGLGAIGEAIEPEAVTGAG